MPSIGEFTDNQLRRGRAYFTREQALAELHMKSGTFNAAISRLIKRARIANPRHGFYLILRPEDQLRGARTQCAGVNP